MRHIRGLINQFLKCRLPQRTERQSDMGLSETLPMPALGAKIRGRQVF